MSLGRAWALMALGTSVLGELPCHGPSMACGGHSQKDSGPSPLLPQPHPLQAGQDSAAHPVSMAMTRADVPGCRAPVEDAPKRSSGSPRELLQDPSAGRVQPTCSMPECKAVLGSKLGAQPWLAHISAPSPSASPTLTMSQQLSPDSATRPCPVPQPAEKPASPWKRKGEG